MDFFDCQNQLQLPPVYFLPMRDLCEIAAYFFCKS